MGAFAIPILTTIIGSVISGAFSKSASKSEAAPTPVAPPPTKTTEAAATSQVRDAQAKRRAGAAARSSILTSPLGITEQASTSPTLLGS